MLSLSYEACRAPAEAEVGRWKGRKDAAPCASVLVVVHESHQALLGSKLSFHG